MSFAWPHSAGKEQGFRGMQYLSMAYSDRHPDTHPLRESFAEARPQPWDKNLPISQQRRHLRLRGK